ncbi:MAG: protease HtpX [Cycloclasticus sp.]|nr:protease HtpX [Cycloclasticus sp.]
MKRVFLFLVTNLAIVFVLGITLRLLGVDSLLSDNGSDLNINSLSIFALVFGMGGSFISLMISKWSAKRMSGARVIEQASNDTERWLLQVVARQADMANIGMPEVAIFPAAQPNAFATGMNKNNALVAVSEGLLRHMNKDEIEAVLAHEISHVANGDMVTLALIQGVVNTFVIFFARIIGHTIDRVVFKNQRGHGIAYFVSSIAAELVLGVLASIIVMWFSRQREFRADSGSASLVGKDKMIAALRKLQQASNPNVELDDRLTAFAIAGKRTGFSRLFMSHPPLHERIEALQRL